MYTNTEMVSMCTFTYNVKLDLEMQNNAVLDLHYIKGGKAGIYLSAIINKRH